MQKGNKSLGMLKNVRFGRETFTLSLVAYITVDFKKVVSDLFHAGSALVENKSIENYNIPRACFLNRSSVPAMDLKSNRSGS